MSSGSAIGDAWLYTDTETVGGGERRDENGEAEESSFFTIVGFVASELLPAVLTTTTGDAVLVVNATLVTGLGKGFSFVGLRLVIGSSFIPVSLLVSSLRRTFGKVTLKIFFLFLRNSTSYL